MRHGTLLLGSLVALLACSARGGEAPAPDADRPEDWRKLVGELDDGQKRLVAAFRKELPEGYELKPVVNYVWSDDEGKQIPVLISLASVGPDGKLDGETRHYGGWGYVVRTVPYVKGLRQGTEKEYHHNPEERKTVLISETPWETGKMHGVKRLYHSENGKLRMEMTYADGQMSGVAKEYDLPGRLEKRTPYERGKRHGETIEYWVQTGKIRKIIPCAAGIVDGIVREFYENGNPKRELPVKNDLFHGIEKTYDEDGKRVGTRYWIEDETVSQKEFDERYGR